MVGGWVVAAELTELVIAPCVDLTVGEQGERMGTAGGDGDWVDAVGQESLVDGGGHGAGGGNRVAIAKLALAVVAPCGDGAVYAECDAVLSAAGETDDGFSCEGAGGEDIAWDALVGGGCVAELAEIVPAP